MTAGHTTDWFIGMPSRKLGMWIFLVGDSMTFAALLAGYASLRTSNETWLVHQITLDVRLAVLMTILLISGSFFLSKAAVASTNTYKSRRLLGLTIFAGLAFIGCQTYEWLQLLSTGFGLSVSAAGQPVFGASFFVITGFHGAHVLGGVIFLAALVFGKAKTNEKHNVEIAGLYWHFIDVIWIFIFVLIYLL